MKLTSQTVRRLTALLLALCLLLAGCADPYASSEETEGPAQSEETSPEPSGAGEAAQEAGEEGERPFTLGYYEGKGLNPYTCNNTTNQSLIRLLYEPLFQQSPDFETENCLALSCVLDGTGSWTLTLRSDVTFWNGETLDAGDVAASLRAAAAAGSIYADRLAPLEDLRQTGEYTLTFTWSEPLGDLTPMLEIPVVQAGTEGDSLPMGTGPYLPLLDEEGDVQALSVHPNWWQEEALPAEQIALYPASDSDMLIYGFESGQITMVSTDLTGSNSLGYSGSYEVRDYPTSYLLYLGCNTKTGPCREQAFRLALQAALDRETIAERLLSGHADPNPLTFPAGSPWYDERLAQRFSEPDSAALEAYAGETVTILVNAESTFRTTVADFLADSLREAGLEAEVSALSWSAYCAALEAGAYDLYLGVVKLEPNFDLTPFFDLDGSLNFSGFSADEINASLAAYLAADGEGRAGRAYDLSLAVSQAAPILPLCFLKHSILSNWGSLGSFAATQSNLFYHFQDWDLSRPAHTGEQEKEGRTAQ
ncbi:MAG: ABC transporter substrate-binding protein [Candidatus Onthomonas sp.]